MEAKDPMEMYRKIIQNEPVSDWDKLYLSNNEEAFKILFQSVFEMYSKNQYKTECDEYASYWKDWGISFDFHHTKIQIWQGTLDQGVTVAMAQYLSTLLNDCPIIFKEQGHFMYFEVFDEILNWFQ